MGQVLWNKETGEAREYDRIDVREILEHSRDLYSTIDPALIAAKKAEVGALDHDEDGKKGGRLSKAEIIEDLTRLGIEHDASWPWTKLNAALRENKAAREAAVNASVEG